MYNAEISNYEKSKVMAEVMQLSGQVISKNRHLLLCSESLKLICNSHLSQFFLLPA